jgi:carbamoyltransferase
MSLIILGINKYHNASATLTIDNEIIFHIESERLTRRKRDWFPFQAMSKAALYVDHIDILAISGFSVTEEFDFLRGVDAYSAHVVSMHKSFFEHGIDVYDFSLQHHSIHAFTAFYNSGFDSALCVVRDGSGSPYVYEQPHEYSNIYSREVNSSYVVSYPDNIELIEKHLVIPPVERANHPLPQRVKQDWITDRVFASSSVGEGLAFQATCEAMGFDAMEGGKIMGMAAYGKPNDLIPPMYVDGLMNQDLFRFKIENRFHDHYSLKFDLGNDFETHADFAYALQSSVEEKVLADILELLDRTGEKNLCLSGGLFLNCSLNYKLLKALPDDVNLYVEPNSGDGGNSVGVARLVYHMMTKSEERNPQTSIYYGPKPIYDLEKINKHKVRTVTVDDVAEIISNKNIVAMFQGRSEAGPRALGNRSILYDPRDVDGKDHVNKIKGREWFRPFAGSVLAEHAHEWFEMHSLKESKFMMFAIDVKPDKQEEIPCITHIDGTCRIQTVSQEDNQNFYDLINSFYSITGVPILFNTSFNLAGDPLVETVDDALETFYSSDIPFLYFPELSLLIEK